MYADLAMTSFFSDGIYVVVLIVSVLIVPSMLIGLVVATFQAATQINEQTLSFLPRLIMTLVMVLFAGGWVLERLKDTFINIFHVIPTLIS